MSTMHCHLCPEVTAIDAIVDHVRLMHPDHYEGTPVVDTTLVDYLRDKLAHADDVVCGCTRGFHPLCPIHGINGSEPLMTAQRWVTYALLIGQPVMGD